jgi:hypothetical protein
MYVRTDMKSGAACYTVVSGDNLSLISQKFYGILVKITENLGNSQEFSRILGYF